MSNDTFQFDGSDGPVDDPFLHGLLDEALSPDRLPGGIPAGMTDRIVAATASRLRGGVIARIGVGRLRRIAAVILLGGSVALGLLVVDMLRTMRHQPNGVSPSVVNDDAQLERLEQIVQNWPDAAGVATVTPIDTKLDELEFQIRQIGDSSLDSWSSVAASMESALSEMEDDDGSS